MEVVQHCANITRPSCDVTHVWAEMSEMYHLRLVGSRGNATLVNCSGSIFPDTDITMEPPRFEIAGFKDHINVMLELPQALPKILTAGGSHLLLLIEEQSEGIVKRHDLQINEATNGNFTYVLDKLMPNTSYCVSVYFDSRNLGINRSPWKCTRLPPARDSESSEPARIGALITVLLVAVVSVSTVGLLKRVGYICLRNVSPKVLNFCNQPAYVVPELPPLEAVATLEVIHVHRKKKVWDYNYDDDSDSDNETAARASAGGYTLHGLAIRPPHPASGGSACPEDDGDPDAWEDEPSEPEVEARPLTAPEPRSWCADCASGASEGWGAPPARPPFSDDSSCAESPADKVLFNVDLTSVFVRVLDDSNTEVPLVPSLPEDTIDLGDPDEMGTGLPVASGQGAQPAFPSSSGQGPWFEESPSDRSDTSESVVDNGNIGDGYLMR
ncbi:interferon alpha/beta receptor 2 isoform X2 [Pteronotus mesoamericanus]|nr:interferon alpha/beta receptor 2 isoform X2 [Pteronotus parnellii mesoamericanus]